MPVSVAFLTEACNVVIPVKPLKDAENASPPAGAILI
jgi:hypothetical protein